MTLRDRLAGWLGVTALQVENAQLRKTLAQLREEHDRLVTAAGSHRGGILEHKCWIEALIRLTTQRGSARERELHRLFNEQVEAYKASKDAQINGQGGEATH